MVTSSPDIHSIVKIVNSHNEIYYPNFIYERNLAFQWFMSNHTLDECSNKWKVSKDYTFLEIHFYLYCKK